MYLDAFDGKMVDALTEQNLLKSEFSNRLARLHDEAHGFF